ncbi:MAG: LuxR family transcriptional regulator [Nocardioides sp.]|nr:LuxR family transcriptional regulator [Nocardioides sp.]
MVSVRRPLRVAIVGDYEIVVAGIAAVLEPYADRVRLIQVAQGSADSFTAHDVDIVLRDGFGRADEVGDLRTLDDPGHPRVVAFSWNVEPAVVSRAIGEGAAGYVAKSLPAEEIVVALERVHAGERVLALGLEDDSRADVPLGSEAGLSGREYQVLTLITEGFTNQEIARQCFLSVNSIKTYVRTAYRKIGVTRRTQAVAWGIEHRLDQHVASNDVAAE